MQSLYKTYLVFPTTYVGFICETTAMNALHDHTKLKVKENDFTYSSQTVNNIKLI